MQLTKQWKYLAVLEYIRLYIIMGVTCFFGMRKWHSFEILFEWFILLWNECFLDLSLFPLIRRNTVSKHWIIVGRGFLTPLFYKDPPPPPPLSLLPCLFGWMSDHATSVLLCLMNDIIDHLNILRLGTLVQAALCCVFYTTRHQIYWRFASDDMVFASILIWYHTHRQTHGAHRDYYIDAYI